jgi:hypothetical protein
MTDVLLSKFLIVYRCDVIYWLSRDQFVFVETRMLGSTYGGRRISPQELDKNVTAA